MTQRFATLRRSVERRQRFDEASLNECAGVIIHGMATGTVLDRDAHDVRHAPNRVFLCGQRWRCAEEYASEQS